MKTPIYLLLVMVGLLTISCDKDSLFEEESRQDLWLFHEGAKLPIVVEGNTQSKIFIVLLHGGPGGSTQVFNAEMKAFTDPLETDYAMVYYDQRNAGLATGEWDEEKLTIEQHVADLDKVIDLLKNRYGNDSQLFLVGHSWGGYLGTTFLLDTDRQSKVEAWININGLTNRNLNMAHVLERIKSIGVEQSTLNINADEWTNILAQVQVEQDKGIAQYDVDTEDLVFDLIRLAEAQIRQDNLLSNNFNSPFSSIYTDNYDPLRLIINGNRDKQLITQMYDFDTTLDAQLENITLPSLNIYGYYDVRTPLEQGEYFRNGIATLEADKQLVILNNSGHESPKNEPVQLAEEIKEWIEKYR